MIEVFSENNNNILTKYFIASKTDLKGKITYASPAFCKISGFSHDELIGKSHSIVKHPDTNPMIFKNMWKAIEKNQTWSGIVKNRKKDGSAYWVDTYIEPIFDLQKNKIGYQSVRFDVTNEHNTAKLNMELMVSVSKFQKLFDSINSGVVVINSNKEILEVNNYHCKILETTKENFLKSNMNDICINSERLSETLKNKNDLYSVDFIEEVLVETEKGRKIWIEARFSYYTEDKIIITTQDISHRKELESASAILLKQSKDAAMGEMISMIAHQWRQPLATIESILAKMKAKRELKMYSGNDLTMDSTKISSLVTHLSKTIDFFRDFLKPKEGEFVAFQKIYESVNVINEPLCKKHKIELILAKDENITYLVDERIDQVILNLYKNSLDAYVQNGKKGEILTEIIEKDETILIKITDCAGGISKEIEEKVLEPYFSTKSKNGTGLGLYMCKKIVTDLLNGKFYFENSENGVSFFIELNKIKKENK